MVWLRRDLLSMESDIAELQETLSRHGQTLALVGVMLPSHGETLREILDQLAKLVPQQD